MGKEVGWVQPLILIVLFLFGCHLFCWIVTYQTFCDQTKSWKTNLFQRLLWFGAPEPTCHYKLKLEGWICVGTPWNVDGNLLRQHQRLLYHLKSSAGNKLMRLLISFLSPPPCLSPRLIQLVPSIFLTGKFGKTSHGTHSKDLFSYHECPNWLSWISKKICTVYDCSSGKISLPLAQILITFDSGHSPPLWFVYDLLMFIDVVICLLFCVPRHPHDRPVVSPSLSLDSPFCVVLFSPFWKQETLSLCQVTHQFTSLQHGLPNPYESNPLRSIQFGFSKILLARIHSRNDSDFPSFSKIP